MLPRLAPAQSQSRLQPPTLSPSHLANKYSQQCTLNSKLKTLLSNLTTNHELTTAIKQQQAQEQLLSKQQRKYYNEVQHQQHALNILISENSKLKEQVNNQRNKRAIYFNVYKDLEHQVHDWEHRYKTVLIETMRADGVVSKIREKFRKATKKVEREIAVLKEELMRLEIVQDPVENLKTSRGKTSRTNNCMDEEEVKKVPEPIRVEKRTATISNHLSNGKKPAQIECEFQLQQKNLEMTAIVNRLKQITGLNSVEEIGKLFKEIDEQIEYNFGLFTEEQVREKQLCGSLQQLEQKLRILEQEQDQRKSTMVKIQSQKKVHEMNEIIAEMQKKLQEKIGMKASQLTNQMLLHQCFRIRDQGKQGKKNLEKSLEQTKKEKIQCNILLSPSDMHKKIVRNQTKMI